MNFFRYQAYTFGVFQEGYARAVTRFLDRTVRFLGETVLKEVLLFYSLVV
jgi:hypothetical protein